MELPSLKTRLPSLGLKLGRSGPSDLVGLDIQPGYAVAAQARLNGSLVVQRAAGIPLPGDAMREGEVLDEGTLAEALRELFGRTRLDRRVRIGVANQRTVLRMLELPPLTDRKELDAAVRFQAEDQMPMPLESAVLDYHPLGVVETPAGPRQRVAVVAAQRDMVERLLSAARRAGLRPEGIDLSAFALIRALHRPDEAMAADGEQPARGDAQASRVLYLNVGGLTNMAIADGVVCRFTRVVGGGLESMAAAVAERHNMPLTDARELLAAVDLTSPVVPVQAEAGPPAEGHDGAESATEQLDTIEAESSDESATEELAAVDAAPEARSVMESGIRDIAAMVRNSLDFHRAQEGGGEVASVVISGPALAIPGFTQALSGELGVDVREQTVGLLGELDGEVSPEHLAVAAGLAVQEGAAR